MASSAIHLAVAKKYLRNNNKNITDAFLKGTLEPDTVEDKGLSHYTNKYRGKDNVSHVENKVNLYAFLKEHESLDDFHMGWFLHLVTDYLFFSECFTTEYLLGTTYEEFCKDLYYGYSCLTDYVSKKFDITIDDYASHPSEYYPGTGYKDCIFTLEQIENFIERVAAIDLENYITKIKAAGCNVKP